MLLKDRTTAGQLLAEKLVEYANREHVLVLALPRGGVPVAFEVSQALNAPLDVLVVRKLGSPDEEELAIGALAAGGVRVINEGFIHQAKISDEAIAKIALQEQRELERREQLYRGDIPFPDLQGRIVILVDDGLATGATMWAAIAAVKQQKPAEIIVAVPVAVAETCEQLAKQVDKIFWLITPSPFYSVGLWYEKFPQTTDEEVCDLLAKAKSSYQQSQQTLNQR